MLRTAFYRSFRKGTLLFLLLFVAVFQAHTQEVRRYNTDSLLTYLSKNENIRQILLEAHNIYTQAGLDTVNISVNAFKIAYLEKCLLDQKAIRIPNRRCLRNKKMITIVDYTSLGNTRRFATIDLKNKRILYNTLVSQGSGKAPGRNDKYQQPTIFSNTVNSEVSSLGLVLTKRARRPHNPCHFCRQALSGKHKCTVILLGMEKNINNNMQKRDIVMHTTGSKDMSAADPAGKLRIKDKQYRIAENECKCYRTGDDGQLKRIGIYASACGIAENNGYIGQSNGCLVLPEDDHMPITETIKRKSLIFIYSDVISDDYNYFENSPVMRKIIRYALREK